MGITATELLDAGINIIVGVPLERSIQDYAFLNLWEIARRGYPILHHPYDNVDTHRNIFAESLKQSEYTHICMLDDDHVHMPDTVERLGAHVMANPEIQVIGGLNFRRTAPFDPCIFTREGEGQFKFMQTFRHGLIEVGGMGMGCVLISRKVFEKLEYPYFGIAYDNERSLREDLYFCDECYKHNIRLWCDTTISSPHIGQAFITEDTWKAHQMAQQIKNAQKVKSNLIVPGLH